MSSEVEDFNRRLLRARDAMDRASVSPLEQPGSPLHDDAAAAQLRDPFGNHIRIRQQGEPAAKATA